MEEFKCFNCGSTNVRFMAQITLAAPMSMYGNLTKRNLRSKEVELWGADWVHCDVYCIDCQKLLRSSLCDDDLTEDFYNTVSGSGG